MATITLPSPLATSTKAGLMSAADKAKVSLAAVQIDSVAFSAVASKTSTAWTAGTYRRLELHLRIDSGTSGNASVTLTGLTGGAYKSYNHYMLGSLGAGSSATLWVLQNAGPSSQTDANIQIATGGLRSYTGLIKDTVAEYNVVTGGMYTVDTTNGVTALVVTFAGASSGWFELLGYP